MVWDPESSGSGWGPQCFGTQRVRALVGDLNGLGLGFRV
jgi:hypothetical protein